MSRNAILALAAAVLLAVGIPVAIVAFAGDDGGGDDARTDQAGQTVIPEGIDVDNAPAEQLEGNDEDEDDRRGGRPNGKGGGPPPDRGPARDYPASGNVAYPNDVTKGGADIARVVERHLGAIAEKADQLTVLGADCRAGGACTARYVSGPHGGGKILIDAAVIVRRILARDAVRSVKLFVHEPRGKKSNVPEPMALMVIACRRADHPGYAWSKLTVRQLTARCAVTEQSPGELGSQIRKGNLSEKDASRGKGGSSGGQGGASGDSAPPGAKPTGSPAPRNVNGRQRRDRERDEDAAGTGGDGGGSRSDRPDAP